MARPSAVDRSHVSRSFRGASRSSSNCSVLMPISFRVFSVLKPSSAAISIRSCRASRCRARSPCLDERWAAVGESRILPRDLRNDIFRFIAALVRGNRRGSDDRAERQPMPTSPVSQTSLRPGYGPSFASQAGCASRRRDAVRRPMNSSDAWNRYMRSADAPMAHTRASSASTPAAPLGMDGPG